MTHPVMGRPLSAHKMLVRYQPEGHDARSCAAKSCESCTSMTHLVMGRPLTAHKLLVRCQPGGHDPPGHVPNQRPSEREEKAGRWRESGSPTQGDTQILEPNGPGFRIASIT